MLAQCVQQYLLKQEWLLHYGDLAQMLSIGPFHISSESVFRRRAIVYEVCRAIVDVLLKKVP